MQYVFLVLLLLTAVFLIGLVLVQRGKGGGLAGAFGGLGGQSAFGTKAGDTFTKITIGVAFFWIVLCVVGVAWIGTGGDRMNLGGPEGTQQEGLLPAPGDRAGQPAGQPAGSGGAASPSAGETVPSGSPSGSSGGGS
jgi:preprotein translocase subunit SecG